MDKIIIKDLELFAYHGVNPEEKEAGQKFIISLVCETDLSLPSQTDNIADTVSYAKIIKLVKRVFCERKYDLIERAAGAVRDAVLREYPEIAKVTVLLKKPDAPIDAKFDYVAVEISGIRDLLM